MGCSLFIFVVLISFMFLKIKYLTEIYSLSTMSEFDVDFKKKL